MADVGATLASWSSVDNSNNPQGTTNISSGLDDNLRAVQGAVVRGLSHKGSDIASAATMDIGAVDALYMDVTGTTTVTALGTVRAGVWRILKFEGALTLTHNATSLILLGAANRTTANGDIGIYLSEGSGNWREVSYFKAAQRPINNSAIASGRNIAARTNAAAPLTTIDMTADELVLKDSSGNYLTATSVSVSPLITASGANGLDTGAEAGNTWYYGWVIANPAGTVAGLISASNTSPTLPSGYTYKALVTAVRNDGSSNFIAYRQFGNEVYYLAEQSALSAGTASAETAVSLTTMVPPNAHSSMMGMSVSGTADAAPNWAVTVTLRLVTAVDWRVFQYTINGSANTASKDVPGPDLRVPNIAQNIYYLRAVGSGTGSLTLKVLGFKLPAGAE